MAWNDPGRNRNPWGNRPDRGAADLDEALRNLQRDSPDSSAAGGGGGGDAAAAGTARAMRGFGAGTVALVLVAIWAATGLYKVDAAERAVVTRFGQYVATTEPGLRWHLPWPIEARQIINVESVEGFSDQTRMLTSDENLVDINIAVQYRRAEARPFAFNVRDPESTLGEVSESAIREIVGRSRLDFVLEEGRQEIAARTKELIQRTLDSYQTGIEVTSVNLQGVGVPEQVATRAARRDQGARGQGAPRPRGAGLRERHPAEGEGLGRPPDRGRAGLQGAHRRGRRGRGRALRQAARRPTSGRPA